MIRLFRYPGIEYGSTGPFAGGGSGGGSLPGVTVPLVSFVVGDGQVGTPAAGSSSLEVASMQGQSLFNKQLLVVREGIELLYSTAVQVRNIRRYNSGGLGGFVFEQGLTFAQGEGYDIYIIGINNTVQS